MFLNIVNDLCFGIATPSHYENDGDDDFRAIITLSCSIPYLVPSLFVSYIIYKSTWVNVFY